MVDINSLKPKSGFLVLEIVEQVETKFGNIFLPESALKTGRSVEGVVHKIGDGCDSSLKIGQSIYFDVCSVVYNDGNIVICPEKGIFCIIDD